MKQSDKDNIAGCLLVLMILLAMVAAGTITGR